MKTSSLKRSMILLALVFFFPLLSAQAASNGVIHFQGAIVESGCSLEPQANSAKFTCTHNGKPVVQTVAFDKLNNYTSNNNMPFSTKIRYLDDQRQLAILEVDYR